MRLFLSRLLAPRTNVDKAEAPTELISDRGDTVEDFKRFRLVLGKGWVSTNSKKFPYQSLTLVSPGEKTVIYVYVHHMDARTDADISTMLSSWSNIFSPSGSRVKVIQIDRSPAKQIEPQSTVPKESLPFEWQGNSSVKETTVVISIKDCQVIFDAMYVGTREQGNADLMSLLDGFKRK